MHHLLGCRVTLLHLFIYLFGRKTACRYYECIRICSSSGRNNKNNNNLPEEDLILMMEKVFIA